MNLDRKLLIARLFALALLNVLFACSQMGEDTIVETDEAANSQSVEQPSLGENSPPPSGSPTSSSTPTPPPTSTPTSSATPTPSATPTSSASPTPSATPTPSPSPTPSATPPGGANVQTVSEIIRHDITWRFNNPVQAGRFANGDWWVIGPVQIREILPQTQNTGSNYWINGSMLNPTETQFIGGAQGYNSGLYGSYGNSTATYTHALNVAATITPTTPLTIAPPASLISTKSHANNGYNNETAAVLTVLSQIPPSGAFRPAYLSTSKSIRAWESMVRYDRLQNVTPTAGADTFASLAPQFERVWLEIYASWVGSYGHPSLNMPAYYRDFTSLFASGALRANTNGTNAEKRDLVINMIQIGLDNFDLIKAGFMFHCGVNGHCNGRKFPILFAGMLLDDLEMMNVGIDYAHEFYGPGNANNRLIGSSEDGQLFYVEQTSPGVINWGYGNYSNSFIGLAEWGNFHLDPAGIQWDNFIWLENQGGNPYRRCCSANAWTGQTLVMHMMNLQPYWNNDALFDYMDRYTSIETPGTWTFSWDGWQGAMWVQYRDLF